jgi:hypothetical protein
MDHLWRERKVLDEVQVWINTEPGQDEDRNWLATLPARYGPWVNLIWKDPHPVNRLQIADFWVNCLESDTIYFRFDDDIVYVHPGYFEAMTAFRLENPDYLLVFPQVWNNGLCSYLSQHIYHNVGFQAGNVEEFVFDHPVAHMKPDFAVYLHSVLLDKLETGKVDSLLWEDSWELDIGKLVSVNSFCFFGEDFAKFGGQVQGYEEPFLSGILTERFNRHNVICGWTMTSHFAFGPQWGRLLGTDVLSRYRQVAWKLLEES